MPPTSDVPRHTEICIKCRRGNVRNSHLLHDGGEPAQSQALAVLAGDDGAAELDHDALGVDQLKWRDGVIKGVTFCHDISQGKEVMCSTNLAPVEKGWLEARVRVASSVPVANFDVAAAATAIAVVAVSKAHGPEAHEPAGVGGQTPLEGQALSWEREKYWMYY